MTSAEEDTVLEALTGVTTQYVGLREGYGIPACSCALRRRPAGGRWRTETRSSLD